MVGALLYISVLQEATIDETLFGYSAGISAPDMGLSLDAGKAFLELSRHEDDHNGSKPYESGYLPCAGNYHLRSGGHALWRDYGIYRRIKAV